MSGAMSADCTCGCLTCTEKAPERAVADPLTFRHAAIKARLLSRIASTEIDGSRPLDRLGTREDDDPAIAFLDAVSGALHVLAWNVARLSDDGSIRRTEDRDALVDLARLFGYEPRPALAATTTLSFDLDTAAGSPKAATIPRGTKVASVPGQDEQPQTFETDASLDARAEWNALLPVQQKTVPIVASKTTTITIAGASTTAVPGDLVLVYLEPQEAAASWLWARVDKITREPALDPPRTVIELAAPAALDTTLSDLKSPSHKNQVVVLGRRAAAFGAIAPDLAFMPKKIQLTYGNMAQTDWKFFVMAIDPNGGPVDLDAVYAEAIKDRFVVFASKDGLTQLGRIVDSTEFSRKDFGLAAKVTRISIDGIDVGITGFRFKVRETAIYIETARETLLITDDDVPLPGTPSDRITVQGIVDLPVGRRVVLTGEEWSLSPGQGKKIAEVAVVKSSAPANENTELVFEAGVVAKFRSTALSMRANAVPASHGDTPATGPELIGSGAASTQSPRFALKRPPLAYVPSDNLRGYAPAIQVRVGDRLYAEVQTLFERTSQDRAYTVKQERDGVPIIQFAGRLPTGQHNVSALYRTGGGTGGNLAPGRLTTVMTPILGVRRAANDVAADGGSEAETIEDMRTAAPQSIRTLDRAVSLADFEAFARTYRGVGKALATEMHVGMRSVVCLTIATTTLSNPDTDLVDALKKALDGVAVPGCAIRIEGFQDLEAQITLALAIDPARTRTKVEAAVRAMLGERFGRAARRFGEALHRNAVLAAVHDVEGVIFVRLTTFALPGGPPEDEGRLLCPAPAIVNGTFVQGGLLSIPADSIQFEGMQP